MTDDDVIDMPPFNLLFEEGGLRQDIRVPSKMGLIIDFREAAIDEGMKLSVKPG